MTRYRVTLKVTVAMLPTLLQTVEKTRGIELDSIVVDDVANGTVKVTRGFAGGKRDKGIQGPDLVLQTLREIGKPMTTKQLMRVLEKRGFAASSVSPFASNLAKQGLITRKDNVLTLVEKK